MKIIIIRHAEVDFIWSKRCSSKDFDSECGVYDSSPIKETVYRQSCQEYKKIYISELSRSRDTAERLFPNEEYYAYLNKGDKKGRIQNVILKV